MTDEKSAVPTEDRELDDLLNSALKDFNDQRKSDTKDAHESSSTNPTTDSTSDKEEVEPLEEAWTRDFIKQAADQFEENLQKLIQNGTDGDLGASFQTMAQTVASIMTEEGAADGDSADTDFQSAIAKAVSDLSTTSENLQSEADLSEILNQASLEDGPVAFLPFVQGLLQHLLSKEILYPSVKELLDKYPEWLDERKATMSPDEQQRLSKQLDLIRKVCTEFEKEKEEDSEELKKKRFETIMSLMEEAQGCGELPAELVGDQQKSLFQIDAEGDPAISAFKRNLDSPRNCRLM